MNESALIPLLNQYRENPSPEIMEKLVEGYIQIPKTLASRFKGQGVDEDDLFQVASMALMKAIERFDPHLGNKFITFATPTIVGDLRNYIRDKGGIMRTSRTTRSILYKMQKVRDQFEQDYYREPTLQELADAMEISREELIKVIVQRNQAIVTSLDVVINDEENDTLASFIGTLEEGYKQVDDQSLIEWIKNHTNSQEFALLEFRFIDELSQRETAKKLGVSQMQISRLEKRIITRLKTLAEAH